MTTKKVERRIKIKFRIRKNVNGTAERPRLSVFRSNKQIYAQVINDLTGTTLASASSLGLEKMPKQEQAAKVGELVAEKAKAAGVESVVFDRNGYLYHGRVKELADGARKGGLKFSTIMAMNKVKVNNDVELKDRLVAINRVTKVTKGGRTFTFAAIVVVGDGNGVIGYGLGKAGEVTAAIAKGTEAAKKNLVKVPVLKGTVPHEVEVAFGGAKVLLKPAAAGTGLKAGGAMRAVLESVGVKDVIAKSKGSSNAHNLVKATIAALAQMRDAYTVAGERGISMDKVFNG